MKKIDYLLLAIKNKLYANRIWIITAFTVTKEAEDDYKKNPYFLRVVQQPWGYSFINDKQELEKIDDAVPNEPLFTFKQRINIDSSWADNISDPIETSIGNLLFNYIAILSSFGKKFPFVTGRVDISKIETAVALKLQDTPKDESQRSTEYFYVDEYVKFTDALQFLSSLSQIASIAATRKSILPPVGIEAFKKELLKKYEGKLTDPVEVAKFEQELLDFDEKFLSDDPSNGTFLSGKIKHTARKKMYLTMGAEAGFTDSFSVVPVINSLDEGLPIDKPEQFTSLMNGLRAGSFSRGAETVKGGVTAKWLLRAANNFRIVDTDCGTKLGIRRNYDSSDINKLIGRYILVNGKTVAVENKETASNYLNQNLIVRSPMYCKLEGDNLCSICAGKKLAQYPTGVTIPLTEVSSVILASSLKAMHSNNLITAKLQLNKAFT